MENMNAKDIEISTVTNYPRGGQQCGRIPVGVTVKHLPTGLRAFCDAEQSQQKNLKVALAMIEYGLAELGYVEEGK